MNRLLVLGAVMFLAVGCGPTVTVRDDVDVIWDFLSVFGPTSEMHTPYVLGASFDVWPESSDSHEHMNGWTLESADPTIFTVGPPQRDSVDRLYATVQATGDGIADLIVRDSGRHIQTRHPIEVRLPDQGQLIAHGLLIIGRTESEATVSEARLLDGGTATFLVHYYKDGRLLYGNGALSVDAPAGVVVATPQTYLFEARDWLQLTPSEAGASSLGLRAGGQHFADVPLTVVEPAAVSAMRIVGENEAHAKKGDWLVALGEASDANNLQIYGAAFSWDVDGQAQTNWDGNDTGDLYRYQYDPVQPKMLAATFDTGGANSLSAVAMIHSEGGFVDSSNNLGCSAAPGAPPATPWILLVFAAIFLARRRFSF